MAHLLWLADDVVINLDTVVIFQLRLNHDHPYIEVITINPQVKYKVDGAEAVVLRTFLAAQGSGYADVVSRTVTGETTKLAASDDQVTA